MLTMSAAVASTKYDGPGTVQDFANARFECVEKVSFRENNANFGQSAYGGGGSVKSTVVLSCSVFSACLASKGYFKNRHGKFDATELGLEVECQ
jgi:hypothetical protein